MKAIISDVHANLEALTAVLADIATYDVEAIYCLGDVVGYGPNPRECLERIMESCQVCILGNHDQAAMWDPREFNPTAEKAAFWTRKQLDAPIRNREAAELRWEYLAERPSKHKEKDWLFVHGSPRNPINEYIFPEDIYHQRKMEGILALVERTVLSATRTILESSRRTLNSTAPRKSSTPTSSMATRRSST